MLGTPASTWYLIKQPVGVFICRRCLKVGAVKAPVAILWSPTSRPRLTFDPWYQQGISLPTTVALWRCKSCDQVKISILRKTLTVLHCFCNAVLFVSSSTHKLFHEKPLPCASREAEPSPPLAAVSGRFTASTRLSILNRRRLPIC